jgi:hypothetical protein
MQDLDWNDLRYVLVLSRTGRLARAAQQLRVNETTIARRVARIAHTGEGDHAVRRMETT